MGVQVPRDTIFCDHSAPVCRARQALYWKNTRAIAAIVLLVQVPAKAQLAAAAPGKFYLVM